MSTFQLKSHTRRARLSRFMPDLDRWIEGMATLWNVSYSEATNRLLREQMELRTELGGTFAKERSDDGTPQLVHVLLERFKEDLCGGMDKLWSELSKLKSNLYLLETMQDRAVALESPEHHDRWRRDVKALLDKRGNKR